MAKLPHKAFAYKKEMKTSRVTFTQSRVGKIDKENPIHILYEAAQDIITRTKQAYVSSKVPMPDQVCVPVWIDQEEPIKITIETGVKTQAEYAIFKAQREKNDDES